MRRFKKNDVILILVVGIIATVIFFICEFIGRKSAGSVTIKVDGQIEGVYHLSEDQRIEINGGTNILVIENGIADMIDADCPDKLCVKQKAISKNNENIICLPNKVVVEVDSSEESEFDSMTN